MKQVHKEVERRKEYQQETELSAPVRERPSSPRA